MRQLKHFEKMYVMEFETKHLTAEPVLQGVDFDINNLPLRDPKLYMSDQIHHNLDHWNDV